MAQLSDCSCATKRGVEDIAFLLRQPGTRGLDVVPRCGADDLVSCFIDREYTDLADDAVSGACKEHRDYPHRRLVSEA